MRKVSLFFLVAALLGAALILGGCDTPTNGDNGAAGQKVGFINDTTVNAAALAAYFKAADIVALGPGVTSVEGIVPAGKTLGVSGTGTKVEANKSLEVKGAVEVYADAVLTATGIIDTAGYITGVAGSVYGAGVVLLPYVTGNADTGDLLTYNKSTAANKAAGSVTDGSTPPTAVDEATVKTLLGTVSSLTVYSLTGIAANTIPDGKALTLIGPGNTATAAIDLSAATAGKLTVATGATLATANSLKGVTNNGTISSSTTTPADANALLGLAGTGTISFTGTVNLGGTTTLELKQNVVVAGSNTLTAPDFAGAAFSGSKTITVSTGGTLVLPAKVTSIGATVVNEGTVTTETTTDKVLGSILKLVTGKVSATGEITALTEAFTVPKDVDLTATAATFATGNYKVTVEADGEATFTKGTFAGLVGTAGTAIVEVKKGGEAEFTAATFAAATVGDIVVAGDATFGAAAVPGGNVTVSGTLQLRDSLTLKKTLTISETGGVALVTGKAITLADATNAKIVGGTAYEITPESGKTDGTLTAGVASTAVVFTATGIGGYDNTGASLVANTTDPTSAATLTFGGSDATLAVKDATTVGGVILDVSSKGKITVANTKTLTLTLGAGSNKVGSGGIFTKAGGVTTINAVKANGVQNTTALNPDTAAKLGAAKIANAGAADSVKADTPASGVITGATDTAIDMKDTFTVSDGTITVTAVTNT